MKNNFILIFFTVWITSAKAQTLSGKIEHFANRSFALYAVYTDSLLFLDSVKTNANGEFFYPLDLTLRKKYPEGVMASKNITFRLQLNWNQYADIIGYNHYGTNNALSIQPRDVPKKSEQDIVFYTVYHPSQWDNFAMDSGRVLLNAENKILYDFLKYYKKTKVAEGWLLEMSRLFPYSDEFSKTLINEYYKRYKKMEHFIKAIKKLPDYHPAKKIALAYYRPVMPDYGMPDGERFKIFREHFWEYFNPNDSLFLFSSVLIDKLEEWVYLHHHHKDSIAGLYLDKKDVVVAINSFIEKTNTNLQNRDAVLQYALKKLDKYEDKTLFLEIYNKWLSTQYNGDCGEEKEKWKWVHDKASVYQNIVPGALAPHFEMEVVGTNKKLSLYDIQADYTLLIFWASWCPHCRQELPRIRDLLNDWQKQHYPHKTMQIVAISLDTSAVEWQRFIQQEKLYSWLHYSELKGWKGSVHKLYNIYATPTIYLLDRGKKIVGGYDLIEKTIQKLN